MLLGGGDVEEGPVRVVTRENGERTTAVSSYTMLEQETTGQEEGEKEEEEEGEPTPEPAALVCFGGEFDGEAAIVEANPRAAVRPGKASLVAVKMRADGGLRVEHCPAPMTFAGDADAGAAVVHAVGDALPVLTRLLATAAPDADAAAAATAPPA